MACPRLPIDADHGSWYFAVQVRGLDGQRQRVRQGGYADSEEAQAAGRALAAADRVPLENTVSCRELGVAARPERRLQRSRGVVGVCCVDLLAEFGGVLPAHAGMAPPRSSTTCPASSAPHARGDGPFEFATSRAVQECFPAHVGMVPTRW